MEDEDKFNQSNKLNTLHERRKKLSREYNVLMRAYTARHVVISRMISRKNKRECGVVPGSVWEIAYTRARDNDSVIKNLTVKLTKCQNDIAKVDRMIASFQKNRRREAVGAPARARINSEDMEKNEK